MEDALFRFEEQVVPHCELQYFRYAFDVVIEVGAGGDCYVVHVFTNLRSQWFPFVYYRPKNPIHHCLKHGWRITETEEHHRWFPQSVLCLKGRLVFVAFLDSYIVVSPSDVQLCKNMSPCKAVRKICDEREGILILDGVQIEASIILHGS